MGFSRYEHWRGLPFSSPEDLPDPGIEPGSPALQEDSLPSELWGSLNKEAISFFTLSPGICDIWNSKKYIQKLTESLFFFLMEYVNLHIHTNQSPL